MGRKKFKLTIELIPSSMWYLSLYNIYEKCNQTFRWNKIKEELLKKEGPRCWVCGKEETRLEAHEDWDYDDENHVQKLVAIHLLCDRCHKIKHIGYWCYMETGRERLEKLGLTREDLIDHFCEINNCSLEEFKEYEFEALEKWEERSKFKWEQDLGEYDPCKETG